MRLPTRRIERNTKLSIHRKLPIPGEIFVRPGQTVAPSDIIGRAALPSQYAVVNVARELKQAHPDMSQVMQKQVGMDVSAGAVLAKSGGRLIGRRTCISPVDGVIAAIVGYRVLIETEARWAEVPALVHGTVESVQHTLSVTISANGDTVDGANGFGNDAFGKLLFFDTPDNQHPEHEGKILLTRDAVTPATVHNLQASGARGIIAGSFSVAVLDMLPLSELTLVAMTGIGWGSMTGKMIELLAANVGRDVALEISRTARRPRILISGKDTSSPREFSTGSLGQTFESLSVRAPLDPQLGWGKIIADNDGIMTVQFADKVVSIPWQNLELLP